MASTSTVTPVTEKPVRRAPVSRTSAAKALGLTLAFRILYSLIAAVFAPHLALNEKLIRSNRLTENLMSRTLHPLQYSLLGVWERFDTLWYIEISRHGYANPRATVFYPLYPALIHALSIVTRSELAAAALISTTATFFLIWGALRLFELDYPEPIALRSILLWCLWPASFAFFGGYPDSLMCALTVWSLWFGRSGRWFSAGTLGFSAGLCKAMGCVVALPLLWLAWKHRDRRGAAAAAFSCAGVACYQGFLLLRHLPPASETYRTYWATTTVAPWTTLIDALSRATHVFDLKLLIDLAVVLAIGTASLMPSVRLEYKLYALAAMCLFLTKHTDPLLQSTARYSLAIFAGFPAMAARLGRGARFVAALLFAGALNLLLFHSFLDWGLVV